MNKKTVAREWLYLLVGLVIGFLVIPLLRDADHRRWFYEGLFGEFWQLRHWVWALAPYILFQISRATLWAVATVRRKE